VFLRIFPAISFEYIKRDERFNISIRGNRKIPSNYTKGFATSWIQSFAPNHTS